MLPGTRKADGSLLVTAAAPSATSTFRNGIAVAPNGAVHVTATPSTRFVNGFMVSDTGQLVTSAGAIVDFLFGIPRDIAGAVRTQLNQVPAATDPFIEGIRVGPTGGMYTSDVP